MKIKTLLLTSLVLSQGAFANIVFQADFKGPDAGTGGANDIVQLGGTGTLATTGTDMTASVSGGQLVINDLNTGTTGTAYALFSPTSAASAIDSWYTQDGIAPGVDKLEGALDFFFTTSSVTDIAAGSYRFIDNNFGPDNDLRIVLLNNGGNTINLQLIDSSSGSNVFIAAPSAPLIFAADTLFHVGVSVATDASTGIVSASLFVAVGDTVISTSSPSGTDTKNLTLDVNTAPNTDYTFKLGLLGANKADTKTVDFDTFRLYDSIPTEFGAIPEPTTVALSLSGFVLLAAFGIKRVRRSKK